MANTDPGFIWLALVTNQLVACAAWSLLCDKPGTIFASQGGTASSTETLLSSSEDRFCSAARFFAERSTTSDVDVLVDVLSLTASNDEVGPRSDGTCHGVFLVLDGAECSWWWTCNASTQTSHPVKPAARRSILLEQGGLEN